MDLTRDAFTNFVGRIGESVVGFITTLYIAHELGPAGLGGYALSVALATWTVTPVNAIGASMSKRTSENGNGGYITAGFLLAAIPTALLAVSLVAIGDPVKNYTGVEPVLIAILVVSLAVYSICSNAFVGREKVGFNGLVQTGERVVRLALIVVLVSAEFGVSGVVLGHGLSVAGSWILVTVYYRDTISPAAFDRGFIHPLLDYSKHVWLDVVRVKGFTWTDTLVLGLFVSPVLVGIYEVAWRITQVVMMISKSLQKAVLPRISTSGGRTERAKQIIEDSLTYPGIFAIPALVGAVIIGTPILRIYGADFAVSGAIDVVIVLLFGALFGVFGTQFVSGLNAINHHREAFWANGIIMTTNILLNVGLIISIGWKGAAVATATAYAIGAVVSYVQLSRIFGMIELPTRALLQQAASATLMGLLLAPLTWFVDLKSVPVMVGVVGLGAVIYAITLLVVSPSVRSTVRRIATGTPR